MNTHNVIVTYNTIPEEKAALQEILEGAAPIALLNELSPGQRAEELAKATVLVSWNFAQEIAPQEYSLLRHLSLLQLITAGVDHIPYANLPASIRIAGNQGAYAVPMAEHALAMTLALAKRLLTEQQKLIRGEFDDHTLNRSLMGTRAGIIGFGGAGRTTARLMRALGMSIYAINQSGKSSEQTEFIGTLRDIEYVLRTCDVVVITLPLTTATKGLIGSKELSWMKSDAILINVARGAILDEEALYLHAKNHPAFSVGIDTWWEEPLRGGPFRMKYPFLELPNVLGSPHNSALVPAIAQSAARQAASNVLRFLNGETIMNSVRREDYR